MLISDLEHLEVLSETSVLQGGTRPRNTLMLSLNHNLLSLDLNGDNLFSLTFADLPDEASFSFEEIPGLSVSVQKREDRGLRAVSAIMVGITENGGFAFSSSASMSGT